MIFQGDFPRHLFGRLRRLEVVRDDVAAGFPVGLLEVLPYLEILDLSCTSYKEIFSNEGCLESHVGVRKLALIKSLQLVELNHLIKYLLKQESQLDSISKSWISVTKLLSKSVISIAVVIISIFWESNPSGSFQLQEIDELSTILCSKESRATCNGEGKWMQCNDTSGGKLWWGRFRYCRSKFRRRDSFQQIEVHDNTWFRKSHKLLLWHRRLHIQIPISGGFDCDRLLQHEDFHFRRFNHTQESRRVVLRERVLLGQWP